MAMPCMPALKPQSAWIFCSAPEMTTVSKPNKKPASAEVIDQKKIRLLIRASGLHGFFAFIERNSPDFLRRPSIII